MNRQLRDQVFKHLDDAFIRRNPNPDRDLLVAFQSSVAQLLDVVPDNVDFADFLGDVVLLFASDRLYLVDVDNDQMLLRNLGSAAGGTVAEERRLSNGDVTEIKLTYVHPAMPDGSSLTMSFGPSGAVEQRRTDRLRARFQEWALEPRGTRRGTDGHEVAGTGANGTEGQPA
jgi:hypothetical protein